MKVDVMLAATAESSSRLADRMDAWRVTLITKSGAVFEIVEQMDGTITVTAAAGDHVARLAVHPLAPNRVILDGAKEYR